MSSEQVLHSSEVLYSSDFQITTQDVLDEISLAISLSGCPLHCKGCHSSFTWEPTFGEILTDEKFKNLLLKNPHISCVLFYGGEWRLNRLLELIAIAKKHNLKVCLYTGLMLEEIKLTKAKLLEVLDYIKVGRWIAKKGGLNKKTTNQKFYKIEQASLATIIDGKDVINNKDFISKSKDINSNKNIIINDRILIDWTSRFYQN